MISPEWPWPLLMPAPVIGTVSVSAVVVVGIMPGGVVSAGCGGVNPAAVVGMMPDRVVMPPSHLVNFCRVAVPVVVSAIVKPAHTRERHAPLQGFQGETPPNPLLM